MLRCAALAANAMWHIVRGTSDTWQCGLLEDWTQGTLTSRQVVWHIAVGYSITGSAETLCATISVAAQDSKQAWDRWQGKIAYPKLKAAARGLSSATRNDTWQQNATAQ